MASYTFSIDATPAQGGEVSLDGVNYQTSVTSTVTTITDRTLYARAANGWRFKWFNIGARNFTDNPYHYGYQDEGYINAYAVFEQVTTYSITTAVSPAGGGTTTGDGTYSPGASCTITATPAAGYTFVRWEKNGSQVSTNASYTFTVSESATYTAVFSNDVVTITLVVHNGMGWGYVGFVGGQSSSQQISKTFQRGSQFTIEATRDPVNFSEFKIWRWRSGSISSTNSTITGWATADETYTAYFAFPITASARLLDDNTKPCPQGEVLITYLETPQTPWAQDVSYERTEPGIIRCRQRSTGGGWTFVKWLWRNNPSAGWATSTNQDLLADDARRFEAIALFKRTPTHLLVNSSDRAASVRLTYDDRAGGTGLLVADY